MYVATFFASDSVGSSRCHLYLGFTHFDLILLVLKSKHNVSEMFSIWLSMKMFGTSASKSVFGVAEFVRVIFFQLLKN